MRIIHLTVTIDRGGSENHLISLIEQQVKNNYKVLVVYLKGKPYWEKHLSSLGVKTHKLTSIFNIFQLVKIICFFKPNIFHAHLQSSEIIGRIALLFFPKLIFIISKHNDENSRFLPTFLQSHFYKFIASRSLKIIAISENVKWYCINSLRISEEKIEVIHYGIDYEIYQSKNFLQKQIDSIKNEIGILKDDFVVGTIARLHPQKSIDTLISAFASILNNENMNHIKLIIVGEGHLYEELKKQVASLNIEKNVVFTGKRSDIPLLLNIFDIFVLCSIYEGLGLVLLEAMSAKVPIIGTRAGAIPEIVGEAGIIIEPKDYLSLSNKILKLKNDEKLRLELSERGYNRIKTSFTLEKMFNKTHNIYIQS